MSRGEAAWQEDRLGVGDELSRSGELDDMCRGEVARWEDG